MTGEAAVVAAIQMVSSTKIASNLEQAAELIAQAAEQQAALVVLPENFAHMGKNDVDNLALREHDGDGPIQAFLAEQARRHGIWLVGGTLPLVGRDPEHVRAACLVYDEQGRRAARYDKIHLYDVKLEEANESYRESDTIEPGDQTLVVNTPLGRMGIAVCYDLRFPEMFRAMSTTGMDFFVLPAAFTSTTGKAHWEILLRARAVENLCYGVAAGQGGRHASERETYGNSLIVDPWGKVLSRLGQGPGLVTATLDPTHIERLRQNFPALSHRRNALWN